MDAHTINLLLHILTAVPFGIAAVYLFIASIKRDGRNRSIRYSGTFKEKVREAAILSAYRVLISVCFVITIIQADSKDFSYIPVPFVLGCGIFLFPIFMLRILWGDYLTRKMFGGFLPYGRLNNIFSPTKPSGPVKIDPKKLRIPTRTVWIGACIGLILAAGTFFVLSFVQWNASDVNVVFIKVFFSGLMGFGSMMTILVSGLSRRLQQLQQGKDPDED